MFYIFGRYTENAVANGIYADCFKFTILNFTHAVKYLELDKDNLS